MSNKSNARKSNKGQFKEIDKNDLIITQGSLKTLGDEYQRGTKKTKVKSIVKDFNWPAFGVIIVANRSGKYYIIDGQHRVIAAKNIEEIKLLPCLVFDLENIPTEAQAFLDINIQRAFMSAVDRFPARIASGDPIAKIVEDTLTEFDVELSNYTKNRDKFAAISSAYKCCTYSPEHFKRVFQIAYEITPPENPITGRLITILSELDKRADDSIHDTRLRNRLSQIGAENILNGAASLSKALNNAGEKVLAMGAVNVINKNLRNKIKFKGIDIS